MQLSCKFIYKRNLKCIQHPHKQNMYEIYLFLKEALVKILDIFKNAIKLWNFHLDDLFF